METWNLLISKRIRPKRLSFNKLIMVGAEGFEPPTLCSQSRCATRLRYAPKPLLIVTRFLLVLDGCGYWRNSHASSHSTSTTGKAKIAAMIAPSRSKKHQSRQVWRRGSPRWRQSKR